jgi:hypothetical protein
VRGSGAVGLAVAWALRSSSAGALEPRSLTEPEVLRQPAQVTNVVDAFDGGHGVDLHFSLAYQHTWKSAEILRETQDVSVNPAAAGGIARFEVADYAETTSRLNLRADVGLYHDLALIVRVPIILSRSSTLDGSELPPGALDGAPGEPLFAVPFQSPNRSGVEYLGVGIDWGILNQWRNAAHPTLLIGAEARFSVSEPMHACAPPVVGSGGEVVSVGCAHPSDINRDGVSGQYPAELAPGRVESLEGDFSSSSRKAGVSRGTTALELHGVVSRRLQRVEPYVGFGLLLESPNEQSDFGADRAWKDGIGSRAGFSLGAEFMPWEVVEQFQRLSFDLRFTGTYRSTGRDYSELFDALGSASASSYRRPNFASYVANEDPSSLADFPSVVDPDSEKVFATGITNVQGHGAYALRLLARWQAGRYVQFNLGGGWALTQRHVVTLGEPCDVSRATELNRAGPCVTRAEEEPPALGAPDPSYRPEVEQSGHRFIVDTASTIDAWVGATVMF